MIDLGEWRLSKKKYLENRNVCFFFFSSPSTFGNNRTEASHAHRDLFWKGVSLRFLLLGFFSQFYKLERREREGGE